MSPLEIVAALLGVIAVWFTVRQNIWAWPIGLVMVLMYAWLFFEVKLYSDMLLQVVFAVLQLYGWWQWSRGGDAHAGRQVTCLSGASRLFGLAIGAMLSVVLGYLMATHTDAQQPWLDASLTAYSLVAQFWMARKRLECWVLWFTLDIVYVGLFVYKSLYLTSLLYAVFVVLAARGWFAWRQALSAR